MELRDYTTLFRRRLWIILVACILAGGAAFFLSTLQPRSYETCATVSVGNFLEATNPNTDDIRSAQELAQTYAVLATTRDVLDNTLEETGVDMTTDELRDKIDVKILPETSLIKIKVTYDKPQMAAVLANELAAQLILHSQSTLPPEQRAQLEEAKDIISNLDQQLQVAQVWLDDINEVLSEGAEPYSADLQWLITQRNVIIDHISRLTDSRTQYFLFAAQMEPRDSQLALVENAAVPTDATNISSLVLTGFGVLGGAAIAAIAVLLYDYFDNTIRDPNEVAEALTFPLLAQIPKNSSAHKRNSNWLHGLSNIGDPVTEHYRMLRTNLLLDRPGGARPATYIIISPGSAEGKSTTAAHLAAVLALNERRVLLIDADLRHPSLHKLFGLPQTPGITAMLSSDSLDLLEEANTDGYKPDLSQYIQATQIQGLQVITSGDMVGHPAEMLDSERLTLWFAMIQSASDADVILIDTPPALAVPDALILASKLDASVILVLRAGQSKTQSAHEIKRQIEQFNLDVAGVVLNVVPLRNMGVDYGSYYRVG